LDLNVGDGIGELDQKGEPHGRQTQDVNPYDKHEAKSGILLNVVIGQSTVIPQLIASKD